MTVLRPLLAACLLLACLPPPVAAQEAGPRELPSAEQLQERIEAIERGAGEESSRTRQLELYRLALDRIAAAEGYARATEDYTRLAAEAPQRIEVLREARAALPPIQASDEPGPLAEADLQTLEQALSRENAGLAALESRLADQQEQISQLQARPARARQELAEARIRREEAEQALRSPPLPGENERLQEARETALLAQRLAADRQIRMLEQELLSLDARRALEEAQRDLTAAQVERQRLEIQELQELTNRRSLVEGAEAAESAQRAVSESGAQSPLLRETASVNAELNERLTGVVSRIEDAAQRQRQVKAQLERLRSRYRSTQQQLEIGGVSATLGEVLRRERRGLPDSDRSDRRIGERQTQIAEARLSQFQLDEARASPEEIDAQVTALARERLPELPSEQLEEVVQQLHQLLSDQASLEEKLSINYGRLADQLLELNRDEQALAAQVRRYRELLDERLFWIASARPVSTTWPSEIARSLAWLVQPENWRQTGLALSRSAVERPWTGLAVLVLTLALLRGRGRIRDGLHRITVKLGGPQDRFSLSLRALAAMVLLALAWPLLLGGAGWLIAAEAADGSFADAAGHALQAVALVGLAIETARQLCRNGGVAQTHFHWREHSRRRLRQSLTGLLIAALPLTFLISLTEWQSEELHRDGLGRLAFVLVSVALSIFGWQVLRPGLRRAGLRYERRRGWWRLRGLLRPLAFVAPLALATLALRGYYYTALQLESRMFSTGALLISAGLAANLGLRWMRLAKRRLARRRLAEETTQTGPALRRRPELDLQSVDAQARTLLQLGLTLAVAAGLWLIWSDLLPALNILDNVVLWQREAGDGERVLAVTLQDLALALLIVALTLVAARNLPGLMEITLLSRLQVDPGNRYAITSISGYLIVAIGLLWAINLMGIAWGQAQWLIAALGVGLGFGLQEIFANFVSGLILLFERPVRVGDAVTIGEHSGRVSRIRIRATTITDWDRRELIIPNKAFITDQLINWTLSDTITRVVLRLSLPREAAPEQLRSLLLEAAAANPRVLRDPEPAAFLVGLEGGLQRFDLHVYVAELGDRLAAGHELHADIAERLRAQGLEVAPNPQRDVHLRPSDE